MPRDGLVPGALPLVGHALAFISNKPGFLARCRDQYGDTVLLSIGGPTWLLNDPTDVKHVLVDSAKYYEKTTKLTSARGRELSGNGLHTAVGGRHVELRRTVQPLFHRRMMESHEQAVRAEAEAWIAARCHEEVVDVWPSMLKLTQQIMLRALFGDDEVSERDAFTQAVATRRRFIEYFFTSNLPRAELWPLPIVWEYRRARATIDRVLRREITRRRAAPDRYGLANDWLSMLCFAEDRQGVRLGTDQVRDEAMTLTSTGYETVAAMLTWTLHLLAHHPGAQQHAAMASELPRSTFPAQVLDEAMRLYPPTWLFVRIATNDDVLPSGHRVMAGDKVYLCPLTMHRHPAWHEAPGQFQPQRFAADIVRDRPRFTFFPFGGGARQCIGEPFARMEAEVVLRHLLRRWALVPRSPREVPLRASIVLEPRGALRVQLMRRATD